MKLNHRIKIIIKRHFKIPPEHIGYVRIGDCMQPDYRCPAEDCGFGIDGDWICCPYCGQKLGKPGDFPKKILGIKSPSELNYEETDTECDQCEYLETCMEDGFIYNVATRIDNNEHYIPILFCPHKKENARRRW